MIAAVGVGPGDPELVTLKARRLIEAADRVAGFRSVLQIIEPLIRGEAVTLTYENQSEALAVLARAHRGGRRCIVCFMGDPMVSGTQLLERVERAVGEPVEVVPGVSSVQIVAARARLPLDEAAIVSFHKRGELDSDQGYLVTVLSAGRDAIVIPRPWDFMPEAIARFLLDRGLPPATSVRVFEHLTADENEWRGTLESVSQGAGGRSFSAMIILLIRGLRSPEGG
jgi:cobalt-precorrin-7 (C5)-methyltransferase